MFSQKFSSFFFNKHFIRVQEDGKMLVGNKEQNHRTLYTRMKKTEKDYNPLYILKKKCLELWSEWP